MHQKEKLKDKRFSPFAFASNASEFGNHADKESYGKSGDEDDSVHKSVLLADSHLEPLLYKIKFKLVNSE